MLANLLLKPKVQYKNLRKQEINQNELGKACFQHDMAHGNFKDLPGRTSADKVLCEKTFNIAKIQIGYRRGRVSMVYNYFDKKSSVGAARRADKSAIKSKIISKQ